MKRKLTGDGKASPEWGLITSGLLAVEILVQGASEGLAKVWDGNHKTLLMVRALPKCKAWVGPAPRAKVIEVVRKGIIEAESAREAARWRRMMKTLTQGPGEGRIHVVAECSGGVDLVDIGTTELVPGPMNRVPGSQIVGHLLRACSTRDGALSVLARTAHHVPHLLELGIADVALRIDSDWDCPSRIAPAVAAALVELQPPLPSQQDARARLALLVIDQILRDRHDAMVATSGGHLS